MKIYSQTDLARMDARIEKQEDRAMLYMITGWLSAMYLIGKLLLWWHA